MAIIRTSAKKIISMTRLSLETWCIVITLLKSGGGGSFYDSLYREAPPERGIFSSLQAYERVGKFVIWVCKRAQTRANR